MQGPSAAANIPQPDTLSSPPLALREAPRRAGSAPNVRREIQRVQPLIGLRWCVFFMRSPGGCCLKDGILPARCGLSCPFQTRSIRAAGQLVPAARPFSIAGRIGILPGLISLAPVVRSHVPLTISSDTEGTSLCSRVSKTQLARGSTGTPCHFPKMEAVVYELALQAVNLPERVQTPSVSPSLSMGR